MSKILRWPLWLLEAIPFFLAMGVFRLLGVDGASAAGGGWPPAPRPSTAPKHYATTPTYTPPTRPAP